MEEWIVQLGSRDFETRETAARRLRAMGRAIHPNLFEASRTNEDPEVRAALNTILFGPAVMGKNLARWAAQLAVAPGDAGGPLEALQALHAAGAEALPHLMPYLDDPGGAGFYESLWLLSLLRERARPAQDFLLRVLERELRTLDQRLPESQPGDFHVYLEPQRYFEGMEPILEYRTHSRWRHSQSDDREVYIWMKMAAQFKKVRLHVHAYEAPWEEARPTLLWGVMRMLQCGRAVKAATMEVDPDVRIELLACVLERIGAGDRTREAVGRARVALAAYRDGPDGR